MIYLIESIGRDERNKVKIKVKSFLKIGYSEDKVFEKRLDTYFLHNPHCELLYTIPEGTQDQEKLLHYKFKKYLAYRREWFVDNSGEIIDFFKTHPTAESLEKEFGTANPTYFIRDITGKLTKDFIEVRDGVKKLINTFYAKQLTKENTKEITEQLDKVLNKYVGEIGKTIFSIENFKKSFTEGSLEDCLIDKNDKVIEFLFKFDSLKHFPDKMKLLCENDLSKKEVEFVLDQVLPLFKSYYLTLGPERCKALCYRKGELDKEINSQKTESSDDFSSKIFSEFNDNDVYTRKEIKEKLCKIYNELGLTKTPKATDLENYFDMKSCQVTIDKIRVNCFKLVKKKGE